MTDYYRENTDLLQICQECGRADRFLAKTYIYIEKVKSAAELMFTFG